MPLLRLSRITFRRGLLAFASVLALWILIVVFVDESPDPGVETFRNSSLQQVPDSENAAVAIAGLTAPRGTDPIEHGRFVVRTVGESRYSNESWTEIRKRLDVPGKISLTASEEALRCWIDPEIFSKDTGCLPESRIQEFLDENRELIARYRSATELPRFGPLHHNGPLLISLNKLLFAEARSDLGAGRVSEALAKWRSNQRFIARALQADGTLIDRAIFLVLQGYSLQLLETIFQHDRRLASKEYAELLELLEPAGLAAYNVEAVLRAEFGMFEPVFAPPAKVKFWVHPQFLANRFYRFSRDFVVAAQSPPLEMKSAFDRVAQEHVTGFGSDYLRDPMNAAFVRAILNGLVLGSQMLVQMHIHEGHKALLALRVEIHRSATPDAHIPDVLNAARAELRDPFRRAPMKWDAGNRTIYFDLPEGGQRQVRL